MKRMNVRPLLVGISLALACVALGPRPFAAPANPVKPATPSGPQVHLSGRSLDAKGVYAGPVDIFIERWSTDEERENVGKPMLAKTGHDAVLAVLEKVRVRVGYVLTPGITAAGARARLRRAWNIEYAREIQTPAGRRIVVASRDHLPIGEVPKEAALGTPHRLDVLEFRFDKDGKGVGKLADGGKIVFNTSTKMIEITKYDAEPIRLADVATQPLRTRDVSPKQYYGSPKVATGSGSK